MSGFSSRCPRQDPLQNFLPDPIVLPAREPLRGKQFLAETRDVCQFVPRDITGKFGEPEEGEEERELQPFAVAAAMLLQRVDGITEFR